MFAHRGTVWVLGLMLMILGAGTARASDPWPNNVPRAEDGRGIKVGNRSTFHPGLAATLGYDSNVFWTKGPEPVRGSFYVTPSLWASIGNRAVRDGLLDSPPTDKERRADYNIGVLAGYRFYTHPRQTVRQAGKLNVGVRIRFLSTPARRFSFGFEDDFRRIGEPQTFEALREFNFNRFDNRARVRLIFRPGGGRLSIEGSYLSELLYFQSANLTTGDKVANGAMAEVKWRVRDRSAIVARYTYMNTIYLCCAALGEGRNEDSNAHRVEAGYAGLLGKKWELDGRVGYGRARFFNDPNGPDFNSVLFSAGVAYYPTLRTRLQLRGFREFQDSLLGNYATDLGGRFYAAHTFRWNMLLDLGVAVQQRRFAGLAAPGEENANIASYENAPDLVRQDLLFTGNVKVEQALGRFFSVALGYTVAVDSTDFAINFADGGRDDAGFVKHMILVFGAVRY